jgi:hypothetical protein
MRLSSSQKAGVGHGEQEVSPKLIFCIHSNPSSQPDLCAG